MHPRGTLLSMLDDAAEGAQGDATAFVADGVAWSFSDVKDLAATMSCALKRAGARPEERALLALDDGIEFVVAFLGAMRCGLVPVPVNPRSSRRDLSHFLNDSRAAVCFVDDTSRTEANAALAGLAPGRPLVIDAGMDAPPRADVGTFLEGATADLPEPEPHDEDMAFWLYSSGSTGRPKAVVHLHQDVRHVCDGYAADVLGLTERDRLLSSTKLFHAYGLGNSLLFPIATGASAILLSGKTSPARILDAIAEHRPTVLLSVPPLYRMMLDDARCRPAWFSAIRRCVSAADVLPAALWHEWRESTGLEILDGVGSTELLHIYCSNRGDERRVGAAGRPVRGYDIRLMDGLREVETGEPGEMHVRGGSVFAFYWRHRARTKATCHGEWYATGDRFRQDEDGFYWYEGRVDDMVKVNGLWVSPHDVEGAIVEHPDVTEAAVVGVRSGETVRLIAFVVKRGRQADDQLAVELRAWLRDRVSRPSCPHELRFCSELPRTVTGKLQRFRLRATAAASGR